MLHTAQANPTEKMSAGVTSATKLRFPAIGQVSDSGGYHSDEPLSAQKGWGGCSK
jgi:hypothetical protein